MVTAAELVQLVQPCPGAKFLIDPEGNERIKGYHPEAQFETTLTPREFLLLLEVDPNATNYPFLDAQSIRVLRDLMCNGTPIEQMPWLELNLTDEAIQGHEGRHRAMVAARLGIPTIPVVIFLMENEPPGARWHSDYVRATPERVQRAQQLLRAMLRVVGA